MDHEYSWEYSEEAAAPHRDGFGWNVLVAVVLALLAHVVLLVWGVNKVLEFQFAEKEEWVSQPVRLQQIQVAPDEIPRAEFTEDALRPESDSDTELLEDIDDLLPELKNVEIDLQADIIETALPEMKLETPALAGPDDGTLLVPVVGPEINLDVDNLGQVDNLFPQVDAGQLIVDAGKPIADVLDPNALAREMANAKGAGGLSDQGSLKGYTGLVAYSQMSPGDLQRNKASIGSDLLFDFNETTLKPDARNTLMTVGMLIERNPDMYCWVEGHSDLIGSDDYNLELSRKRAQAVQDWLVQALRISSEKIVVRPFGKTEPIVFEGDADQQAPNRRVDIKMRKTLPDGPPLKVRVTPGKAVVIGEGELPPQPADPPQAIPVEEDIPMAVPVEEDIPEARPVDDSPPRALVVPE